MNDLSKKTSWDLSPLGKSDDDPKFITERIKVKEKILAFRKKWFDREDYLTKPDVLLEALDEYEYLMGNYGFSGDEGYYLNLRQMVDQIDTNLKAKSNKLQDFEKDMANEIRFFELRIGKISEKIQNSFLNFPGLKKYHNFLKRAFVFAKHQLSEPEEKIMSLKNPFAYSKWVEMTEYFLSKEEREVVDAAGKKSTKNFSEIMGILSDSDKKVRDSAAGAVNEILKKWVETAEIEINAVLGNHKIDDELRHMTRPDMGRHLADDIDSKVVDTMLSAVSSRFDIPQKYYQLKAKILGVPKLAYHERNVLVGKLDKKYDYKESIELVHRVLNNLDMKFGDIVASFASEGRIDVFPKKGKRSGACCVYFLPTQPNYALLNYNGEMRDITTIAHELGHGINFELMKKQNALNYGMTTSTGEVASTFMEDFVFQEILKSADEEVKFSLMMNKLNDDISTIFRQTACYLFEKELHEEYRKKGYLSHEEIGEIFLKHMAAYMGDYVEQSEGSENWWVYWSHIRMFFYVYSYASGLLISKSLQSSVKKNPKFISKVKEFLSAGMSDSPENIFLNLGVNIKDESFWKKGIDEVEQLLSETENLAKKLKKC